MSRRYKSSRSFDLPEYKRRGFYSKEKPELDSGWRRNDGAEKPGWIPASAGMTGKKGRNWIPAGAGMTVRKSRAGFRLAPE
jgi:hypothetical protein